MCLSVENVIPVCTTQNHTQFVHNIYHSILNYTPKAFTMLSLTASRALQSTRLLVDMSTPSWMKGTSSFVDAAVSVGVFVFMFLFAMLYLYCLVTLIISTFTEISKEFKMIHHHRLSDISPTTSSKNITTTDADDEDTSADEATTVNATVEEFFDAKYSHKMWMDELLIIYFEYSILLHQRFIQFYQAEFIEETLGYVSIFMCMRNISSSHIISYTLSNLLLFTSSITILQLHRRSIRNQD